MMVLNYTLSMEFITYILFIFQKLDRRQHFGIHLKVQD